MTLWDIIIRCLIAAPLIVVMLGFGVVVSGILDRAPFGREDVDGWRRVPPPNERSRRSGRESW
jgi:hypothetical protein